jgi:hypothetical protein
MPTDAITRILISVTKDEGRRTKDERTLSDSPRRGIRTIGAFYAIRVLTSTSTAVIALNKRRWVMKTLLRRVAAVVMLLPASTQSGQGVPATVTVQGNAVR